MGLSINSNIPALGAQRQANQASGLLAQTLRQLSSGQRINRAADGAAELAIAEALNTQLRQGQVEINNLQSGVSLTQTAEGGLSAQQDATQRLRELSLQASNGTLSDDQRAAINAEAQQLVQQIDDTANQTEFNGIRPLDGSQPNIDLGTEGGAVSNIQASTAADLGIDTIDLSTQAGAQAATNTLDTALTSIEQNRANLGAQQNRFESAINQREIANVETARSESVIRDLDFAQATVERTRNSLLLNSAVSSIAQSGVVPQTALSLLNS